MKILTNKKIKFLFYGIFICVFVFILVSVLIMNIASENTAIYIFICALFMALMILIICCEYFKNQNMIIENATAKITEYISGNPNARIQCNDEGELYILFHEVNSLVSILNAHIENEMKSKKFLKNIIADISHQLKTPLAALNIYNGILQDESENPEAIQEFTNLSEQELDRVQTLIQNLLKNIKIDSGTVVLDKELENIYEMLESVKAHFSFRAAQEGKEIYLIGDNMITFLCDHNWLIEAIDNIVKNALDHTEKGDHIYIEWKQFPSIIQISIKDDGSGIHPEDLYHIFKRFYRSRFSKNTQGIGLGLPLAKSIIEAHTGTVKADSELGIGTTFIIDFLIPTEL